MTTAIRETDGTVDKFIGDAVMTFWNAPTPHPDHAKRACRAALGWAVAARELYDSAAWKPLPPLVTRFGIHTATVMVGHFGAPDRLSYTALGDGVNIASRLESLCKQYDLTNLVSEAVYEGAKDEFSFRLVDRVAVKGKHDAVRVYELLGPIGAVDEKWEGPSSTKRRSIATRSASSVLPSRSSSRTRRTAPAASSLRDARRCSRRRRRTGGTAYSSRRASE